MRAPARDNRKFCIAVLLAVDVISPGCAANGPDHASLADTLVQPAPAGIAIEPGSDENSILTTVAGAEAGTPPTVALAWTNEQNGNSGSVTIVEEEGNDTQLCRSFIASRQSYDGVSQFTGEACRNSRGANWFLNSIEMRE
ncbi:RT0821/Lpp0805 family surface protein [Hoeflea sp. CAU 1731]